MEMTGGNRYLLASVLDGWTNLYSDTSSPGDVPSSVHLPEAGQRLFDRVCRTLAITPEKANEFISWLQQKKSRRWIASSPNIDNRLKYWVEGGIVLRQSEAYSKSRYLVPRAFHDVVFAMGI